MLLILHLPANATLREHQLIVDWLEQTSAEQTSMQIAHYGDRSAMAWENTLHQLQVSVLFGKIAKDFHLFNCICYILECWKNNVWW